MLQMDADLRELLDGFQRLAERQAATGVTFAIKAHRPPATARETLHLFMGEEHGSHSVAEFETINRGSLITCSCGHKMLVDADAAHRAGVAPTEVKHGLRNAPRKAKA
jgi:hypothetical protein